MTVVFVCAIGGALAGMMYVFDSEGRSVDGTRHWLTYQNTTAPRRDVVRNMRIGNTVLTDATRQWIRVCTRQVQQRIDEGVL